MIFVLGLALAAFSQQLTPIPSPYDGFLIGPLNTNYTIDVFYDHLCSDSKAAFPGLYSYWTSNQAWLGLRIHIVPLPYLHFSFVVAQAGRFIQTNYPSKFINFLSYMFQNQSIILNGYPSWDFQTVNVKVAGLTNLATGVSTNDILNALNDDDINWSSRVSYKYAASRTITGTPQYLINEVWVSQASTFTTVSDWATFFSGLN